MLSDSGEKLNLSSGMASAASTNCFSMELIWRSTTLARVGAGWGEACACGAGVAGLVAAAAPCPWLTIPTAKPNMASRHNILKCFIVEPSSFNSRDGERYHERILFTI